MIYRSLLEPVLKSSHEDRIKLYYEDWFCFIKSYLNFESDWLEFVAELKQETRVQKILNFINEVLLIQSERENKKEPS